METKILTTEELFGKKKEEEKPGSGFGGGWNISGLIKEKEEEQGIKTTEELFGTQEAGGVEEVEETKTEMPTFEQDTGPGIGGFGEQIQKVKEQAKPEEPEKEEKALEPPVKPEEIKIQENNLKSLAKTYSELESAIDTDYKQYIDLGNQLDELEAQIQDALPDLLFMLNQKYNRTVNQHNELVDKIKGETSRYETLYNQLNEEGKKYEQNITAYNQWTEAQAKAAEPKDLWAQLADIRVEDLPKAIPQFFKGVWHGIVSIPQSVGGLMRQWGESEQIRSGVKEFPADPRWQGLDEKMYKALYENKLFKKQLGKAGEFASEKGQEIIEKNIEYVKDILPPEEATEAEKLFFDVGSGYTSLGLAIGASVLTGSHAVPALLFGAHAMGHTYQEAREAEVDPLKASALGAWNFATEAGLEYVGIEFILTKLPFSRGISMALKGANEAFQEYMQEAGSNLVAKYGWDEMRKWNEGSERSALIGFIVGGSTSVVIDTISKETGAPKEAVKPIVENYYNELKKFESDLDKDQIIEEVKKAMAEGEVKPGIDIKERIRKDIRPAIISAINIQIDKLPKTEIKMVDVDVSKIAESITPQIDQVIEETIKTRAEIKESDIPVIEDEIMKKVEPIVKKEAEKLKVEPKTPFDIKPPKREDVERQVEEVVKREIPKTGLKLPDFDIPNLTKKLMPKVASTIKDFSLTKIKELRTKPKLVEADVVKLMDDLKVEIDKKATEELWKLPELNIEPKKTTELEPGVTGSKQFVRGILDKEGIPIEWVNKQIAQGKSANDIAMWLSQNAEKETETTTVKFIENLDTVIKNKENLDYKAEERPGEEPKAPEEINDRKKVSKGINIGDTILAPNGLEATVKSIKDENITLGISSRTAERFDGYTETDYSYSLYDYKLESYPSTRSESGYKWKLVHSPIARPTETKAETKAPEPTKEPWQMTQKEYEKESKRLYETLGNERFVNHPFYKYSEEVPHEWFKESREKAGGESVEQMHYRAIKRALKEGKTVPEEVLKDYPELKETPKTKPKFPEIKLSEEVKDEVDTSIKNAITTELPKKGISLALIDRGEVQKKIAPKIMERIIGEIPTEFEERKTHDQSRRVDDLVTKVAREVLEEEKEDIRKMAKSPETLFNEKAEHEHGKVFDKLTAAQKRKIIEMVGEEEAIVIPDQKGEYTDIIGMPTRGFEMPVDNYMFYASAKQQGMATDSHMLISEREAVKNIVAEWEIKIKKKEIKAFKDAGMSQKEAEAEADRYIKNIVKETKPIDKKTMDDLFATARNNAHEQPAEIQGHRVSGKDSKVTFLSDGQVQAAINTDYLSFLNKYLPDYTLHLQGELEPILIKVKEKGRMLPTEAEAGLVMPIRMDGDFAFAIDEIRGEVKRPPAETLKKAQEFIDELKGLDKTDRYGFSTLIYKDDVKYMENDYWLWEHKDEVYGYLTAEQKKYIDAVDDNIKYNVHLMPLKLYDKFSRTREGKDYLNEHFGKDPANIVPSHREVIIQRLEKRAGIPIEIMESYPQLMKEYNDSKDWYLVKGEHHYFLHESMAKEAHDTLIDIAKRYTISQEFIERETPRIEIVSKRERISDNQRALHKAMLEIIQDPVYIREIWKEAHAKDEAINERAGTIVGQIKEHGAEMDFDEFNTQLESDLDSLMEEDKKLFKAVWEKLTEGLPEGKKSTNHDIWERIIEENTPFYERKDEKQETLDFLAKTEGVKLEPEPVTPKRINKTQIMTWAENAFNIPIKGTATHKWRSAAGKYYPRQQIIRMEKWGELGVATHEIAHSLDYQTFRKRMGRNWAKPNRAVTKELADLDYDQGKSGRRTHEGFAEYMRYRLTTDKAAELAPGFHKHFNEEILPKFPDIKKKLDQFKEMMDTWNKQGAENRVIQHIDWKGEHQHIGGIREKLRQALEWLNVHFNDEFYYPQKLTREIEKALGKKLRPTMNPAIMLEYSKSKAGAIARTFVMDKAIDEYGNVVGPGLIDILKPIARKDMKSFIAYAVSKKAINVTKRGIESGFDMEDAVYIVKKYKDKGWDPVVDEVTKWNNHALDWLVRAGAFDEATAQLFRDLNPVYLPFKRAFLDEMKIYKGIGGYVDTSKGIKAMKGSGRPTINPMESMITQMRELIAKAQKIRIAKTLIDISEQEGMGGFITRVPAPIKATKFNASQIKDYLNRIVQEAKEEEGIETPESEGFVPLNETQYDELLTVFTQDWQYMGKDNIVSIWRDGQRRFYEIHPDLYEALKGVDPLKLGPITRVFAPFARMLRLGATGLKFSFGLARNPFRDAFSYAVFSKRNSATLWDPIKGYYKDIAAKPGEITWRFKKLGGGIAGQIGFDRASVQNTYDEMLDLRLGKKGKALHVVKHPVIALQDLISITEMGPRSSEIEAAYKKYTSKEWLEKHPDWTEEDAFVQAFNDAQDVTVNFTKSGKWAKQINQVTAFFNVSIRGPEKVYRSFRERPIQTLVKGMVWCTLLALGNWHRNKDKDWYKNLPPAYKYNNIWFEIGENVYRLPIPFELGIVFMSAPQAMLDTFKDKTDQAYKGWLELAKSQVEPIILPMPSVFRPAYEVATNKNWLGVPIESEGLQYLYPTERKRDYTSNLAVSLSKGADEIGIKLSPIQIDYMIDGYSGGFLKQFRVTGDQLADYPVIGDLILRDPGYPKRQLNEFFSDYELLGSKRQSNIASRDELRKYAKIKGFYSYYKTMQDRIKRAKEQKNNKLLKTYYKQLADRLERYGYK